MKKEAIGEEHNYNSLLSNFNSFKNLINYFRGKNKKWLLKD